MIELSLLVWVLSAFFAYVGWTRGWTKEVISMAGIVLGLFALYQFDFLIRQTLFGDLPLDQKFYLQTILFLVIVFFAYQTRALDIRDTSNRDILQTRVLGALVGFANGYLISGTIWYFLDINRIGGAGGAYPLTPFIVAPPAGTTSAAALSNLPLYLLTNNGTNGDLLSLAVVVLFIVVLVII